RASANVTCWRPTVRRRSPPPEPRHPRRRARNPRLRRDFTHPPAPPRSLVPRWGGGAKAEASTLTPDPSPCKREGERNESPCALIKRGAKPEAWMSGSPSPWGGGRGAGRSPLPMEEGPGEGAFLICVGKENPLAWRKIERSRKYDSR